MKSSFKRASDKLTVVVDSVMSPQEEMVEDGDNQAKRLKLDKYKDVAPSKVVHLRNVPNEVTEADILQLGLRFGRVTNVLILVGKRQAFLEMEDESMARNMVTSNFAELQGFPMYAQYSIHQELDTNSNNSNATIPAQAALQAASAMPGTNAQGGAPTSVIKIIVNNVLHSISLEVLHQIFSRFGEVLKIVTFSKENVFQALIQFSNGVSAERAKLLLDGQDIYKSCCTLRIQHSLMADLHVQYNNDQTWDYTNPRLLKGHPGLDGALDLEGTLPSLDSSAGTSLCGVPPMNPFSADMYSILTAATNGLVDHLRGGSCVLLVSNLPEKIANPDALFTLFGVYGDVQRVRVLYRKPSSALIQLSKPYQALLAILHLDHLHMDRKYIRVVQSKYDMVQQNSPGAPDMGLMKVYEDFPLHRFKLPGSRNYVHIYPPSATLHLSGLLPSMTKDEVKALFADKGFTIDAFKFFRTNKKMALMRMSSVEDAVMALIEMHNFPLAELQTLRVSFSNK